MARITIHSIIGMPELTAHLSSYLTTADLARAMATCKAWSHHFGPFLWTHLRIKKILPGMNTLGQNLHRIRTFHVDLPAIHSRGSLDTHFYDVLAALSRGLSMPATARSSETVTRRECKQAGVALCTNLQRIKIQLVRLLEEPEDFLFPHLMPLLHNNGNLTHLHLEYCGTMSPPTLRAISALSRLQHLTIRGNMQTETWFLSLLRACLPLARLSEFYCYFAVQPGDYAFEGDSEEDMEASDDLVEFRGELKAILEEAIAARTSENGTLDGKIKALRFPSPTEGDLSRIIFPMLRSALIEIETLEVPELFDYLPEEFHEEMVCKHCPGLRHLIIPRHYGEDHPTVVCSFIRGASALKTVRGTHFTDAYGSTSSKMIPTLMAHHSRTLEELEFLHCRMIRSMDQQDILASCKRLKRFWVEPDAKRDSELGIRFQDILAREWACLGLKELCLTLNRTIDYASAIEIMQQELSASKAQEVSEEGSQVQQQTGDGLVRSNSEVLIREVDSWAAKRVYTQIGRLVDLETLALGTDVGSLGTEDHRRASEWDLTLSKGWLADLSGLKNLRRLQLRTDYWSRMAQAEVEFLDAEWPLLGDISFSLGESELRELAKQPHWHWLQQRRPGLCLKRL
ncbi:hypothetical protein EC968_009959 [Mortierella alpina]|nr:hypothetical protein EC968_009959 [Mortierella alpina]